MRGKAQILADTAASKGRTSIPRLPSRGGNRSYRSKTYSALDYPVTFHLKSRFKTNVIRLWFEQDIRSHSEFGRKWDVGPCGIISDPELPSTIERQFFSTIGQCGGDGKVICFRTKFIRIVNRLISSTTISFPVGIA